MEKVKVIKKGMGYHFAALAAILTAANLLVIYLYITHGVNRAEVPISGLGLWATIAALVLEILLLFGDYVWTEFAGILAVAGNAYGFVSMMQVGLYNITDAVKSINQFGDAGAAIDNYVMAALYLGAILLGILACFTKKRKAKEVSLAE